jgi:hypothetical protein
MGVETDLKQSLKQGLKQPARNGLKQAPVVSGFVSSITCCCVIGYAVFETKKHPSAHTPHTPIGCASLKASRTWARMCVRWGVFQFQAARAERSKIATELRSQTERPFVIGATASASAMIGSMGPNPPVGLSTRFQASKRARSALFIFGLFHST